MRSIKFLLNGFALSAVVVALAAVPIAPASAAPALRPGPGQFYPVWHRAVANVSIAATTNLTVRVTGVGAVPAAANVESVTLNITARGTGGAGGMTVWPSGTTQPGTRALSYRADASDATLVVVKTGTDGQVVVRNAGAVAATVSVDIHGYTSKVAQAAAGSMFVALPPARTANFATVPANGTYVLSPLGQGGVPASGVTAVAFSLAAHAATAGWLTVYPSGGTRPVGANLAYGGSVVTQNLVVARLGSDGKAVVHNAGSAAAVIWTDVQGYYVDPASTAPGAATVPLQPARIVSSATVPANGTYTLAPLGAGGVPATGVTGVGIALTGRATAATQLHVYPSDVADPGTHTLNLVANQDLTAYATTKLGADGRAVIRNTGTAAVTIRVDVYVYFRAPGRPGPPSNVRAYAGDKAAIVTWTPSAADGGATIAYYAVSASPGGQSAWVPGDATAAGVGGLTNGQEYTFTVVAITLAGGGTASDPSAPSPPVIPVAATAPGPPLIVDTYPRDTAVRVTWSPPDTGTAGLTRYVVTASPGGASVEAPPTDTQATVTGLTNGTRYTFTVSAVNGVGTTASAPSRPVAPQPARTPLSPPLTQVIPLSQRVDVQWAAPSDGGAPITGYTVAATPGGPTVTVPAGTTLASLTGLTNGTSYTISVRATNKAGASAPSIRSGVVPLAARVPQRPTGVRAGVPANGSVRVSWVAPVDTGTSAIGGYGITASPGGAATIAPPTATQATLTGLDPAIAYTFTVVAVNATGPSQPSLATTPVVPKVTVKAAPVVLSAASVAALRQVHPDGTLDFELPPAQVANLVPGNVVIVAPTSVAPRGFFGKVSSVQRIAGLTIVSTEDGALSDVLTDGAFAAQTPLTTDTVATFTALRPGVELSRPAAGGFSAADDSSARIRDGALVINFQHRFDLSEAANAGNVEATLRVDPDMRIGAHVGLSGIDTDTTLSLTVDAVAKGTIGPIAWTGDIPLAKVTGKCFDVQIGPVPVWVCPEFTVKIKVKITAGGGVEFDVGYGREVGVRLHTHNTTVEAEPINNEVRHDPALVRPFGIFDVTVGVPIEANLYLYNIGGPGGKAEPYVHGLLDTRATEHCWTIEAGFIVDVWVRTREFYGQKLDWTREKLVDVVRQLGQADGPCQGIRVVPENAKTAVGQAVQFTVESLGGVPTTPITWRVVSGPGSIDATGRYTHNADGYAIVEAVRPASGGLPEFTSRGAVTMGNPAPAPPTITKLTPGPFSAEVTWTPPVVPPGQTITKYAIVTSPVTRTTYVDGTQTRGRISGLTAGEPYLVQVRAIAGTLVGSPSPWAGPVVPRDALTRIGKVENISPDSTGDAGKHGTALSGNGRYLFFITVDGSDAAPPEIYTPGGTRKFLLRMDLQNGDVVLASRTPAGAPLEVFDTANPTFSTKPAVAPTPDGNKVAFVSEGAERSVYVGDVSARTSRLFFRNQGGIIAFAPSISDDASVVTFAASNLSGTTGRHLYRTVNGAAPQRVDNCFVGTGCDTAAGNEMSHGLSADGNKIVYQEHDNDPALGPRAHTLLYDAATGSTRDLTPGLGRVENFYEPAISPDGSTWSAGYQDDMHNGVIVKGINAGRPGPADLIATAFPGQGGVPAAFSRDGSVLAFRFRDGVGFLVGYVYRRGGGIQRLPSPGTSWNDWGLDLSDDGTIMSWQRAECSSLILCSPTPGLFPTRIA